MISAERRVWAFSLGVAAILLFVFLWMYGQQQRTDEAIHSWKHFTYNDFIALYFLRLSPWTTIIGVVLLIYSLVVLGFYITWFANCRASLS